VDLVEWMVRLGAGDLPPLDEFAPGAAWSVDQVRIMRKDPAHDFRPNTGTLTNVRLPAQHAVKTWVENGTEVTPFYDPMLAKIIVRADNRESAVSRLSDVLAETRFDGIETNLDYLRTVIAEPEFCAEAFLQASSAVSPINLAPLK